MKIIIHDPQIGRDLWKGKKFTCYQKVVEALADYHRIDYINEEYEDNLRMYLVNAHDTRKERFDYLIKYGQRELEILPR